MKKNYINPVCKEFLLETKTSAMEVIASEQGIGYGGEDPGDGTIDPEARERHDGLFDHNDKEAYGLW